jgi:uncharacterized SAM-binding protein YcdF (DUF218 family)
MAKRRIVAVALIVIWMAIRSGRFLVIDNPQKSDVILVLAGETGRRPTRALELLNEGYASRIVLDVPAGATAYGTSYVQLAEKWANSLPQTSSVTICPIYGLSTKAETNEADACLRKVAGKAVLIVTSDFHTRRALSIFRHQMQDRVFSVAAVRDPTQFGEFWWRHRQWAKTNFDEWARLIWWEVVDRWL